ncbi:MAG TPA: SDR family oxidoreductase [Candidatus Hydrogenedentes bacterium]|nr:SDR family oxidoreductase [Candidatus Hydrogenedentota bacterium]HPG69018.1 SDR family oxidoreductase [Candidatus Hydrogenedentota bacterium]
MDFSKQFDLTGKVAVVTGGGGVLGGAMAQGLAYAGAKVAIADVRMDQAEAVAASIKELGGDAKGYQMDAFRKESIEACCEAIYADFGQVDVLVNAVGGNMKGATTSNEQTFFDLPADAIRRVFDLNIVAGAIIPCQVFVNRMRNNKNGASIINISSMNAFRPLTRIPGYSAAKAAVSNFTQWLAVHLAQEYNPRLRVNAIAPGFFLTDQNRFLLLDEKTGELTARGKTIIDHTPMGEFGEPDFLVGVLVWLASEASRFVTGIVVPIDGGFSAFAGV